MGTLGSVLDELLALDPRDLPGEGLAEEIVEGRRQANRTDGLYLKQLIVLDRTGAALAEFGSTQAWVRAALRVSPSRASRDVHLARDLADGLPLTLAALCDGSISLEHAQVIASIRGIVSEEYLAAAEPHLVEAATWKNPAQLRKVTAHVVHSHRPDKATLDEQSDYEARSLHTSTTIAGIGVGNFTLHQAGMELFMTALHACARPVTGDDRTPAQRRADALLTMAELVLRGGQLPDTGGVKPQVSVIATLDTLTGADGAPAADYGHSATTTGEWARRFSCDASIARIVFAPDGAVLDAGRATRTFTPAQRRAIIVRDRHCVWPGCDAPPSWCDAHHATHWAHGGTTAIDNAALLCGRHHDRVHAHGHAITRTRPGPSQVDLRPGSNPHWQGHQRPRRT